jgi:dolichol-phosphate mannosyltransferase
VWFAGAKRRGEAAETNATTSDVETVSTSTAGRLDISESTLLQLAILLLAAGLLFFARIGCPLQEPEEPRYAEIPRQMLQSGNFIVPVLHGEPYYDKPPLLYWLVMASYKIFGVSDWSARLVPASAALLTILVTYLWGRCVAGSFTAFIGAGILCLSARFIYLGRLLTMNSLLCLWVIAASAAGHLALNHTKLRWRWWLISAAACGLGLLTKGPVVLALVLVPLLILCGLDRRTARPGARGWIGYACLSVLLAAPWYFAVAIKEPPFVSYFFWKHNLVRYFAPFDHAKPAWYYAADVALGMLPWSFLLPAFARYLFKRTTPAGIARPPALGVFVLAAGWCFVFFSAAGSKRAGYILPAMPPLALALGCFVEGTIQRLRSSRYRLATYRLGANTSFIVAAMVVFAAYCVVAGYVRLLPGLVMAAAGIISVQAVERLARGGRWRLAAAASGIATLSVFLAAAYLMLPGYARRFSMRGQVRPYMKAALNPEVTVICYPRRWDSVTFYLGRDDVKVYSERERTKLIADVQKASRTLAFIKSDQPLDDLLRELPGSLEFVPQGRQGSIAAGWICPRREAPEKYFAAR